MASFQVSSFSKLNIVVADLAPQPSTLNLQPSTALRLRVKDVDFGQNQVVVREGKGFKDRVTMLPGGVKAPLAEHLERTFCHASAGSGLRYPHVAGPAGAQRRFDYANLHACDGSTGNGGAQPARFVRGRRHDPRMANRPAWGKGFQPEFRS